MILPLKKTWLFLCTAFIMALFLSGCGHTVNLTEKRIDGIDSQIMIALPGNAHELPLPVTLDPLTQRYLKGQRFYGEINQGLHIGIFTVSIDSGQMYSDLHLTNGQALGNTLSENIERASQAILSSIDAENISVQQEAASVSGEHAVKQTYTFTVEDKRMKAQLMGFSHGNATWVILVACEADSKNAPAIDDIMKSITITK